MLPFVETWNEEEDLFYKMAAMGESQLHEVQPFTMKRIRQSPDTNEPLHAYVSPLFWHQISRGRSWLTLSMMNEAVKEPPPFYNS